MKKLTQIEGDSTKDHPQYELTKLTINLGGQIL